MHREGLPRVLRTLANGKRGSSPYRHKGAYTDRVSEDQLQRTTVRLPKDLHRWLRIEALQRGVTATDLIIAALERERRSPLPPSQQ
jgi:hypothetical protein